MRPGRPMWTLAAKLVAGALVIAASGVIDVTSSAAATATYTNPTACSAAVQGGVCISYVSIDYEGASVSLQTTVGKATNPATDPNWLTANFPTAVLWGLSTTSSATAPTYVAEADSNLDTPGTFSGVVFSAKSPFTVLCDSSTGVTVSYSLATNQYGLSFPSSCIGSPASLSVQADWEYSTASNSAGLSAAAPGVPQTFSSCCNVTSSADPTTSTTPTTSGTPTTSSSTTTSTSSGSNSGSTTSSTTTTVPTSTTTTLAPTTAASLASIGTGNSGSGASPALAATGAGDDTPFLGAGGALLLLGGSLGARLARKRASTHRRAE